MIKKNKSLGELETAIMDIAWEQKAVSVRAVLDKIRQKRKIAYTTVMTVMARLCGKGFLSRKINSAGAYIYEPTQDKEAFLSASSKRQINDLLKEFGDVAVAQFIDIVESSNKKKLKEWRKRLRQGLNK